MFRRKERPNDTMMLASLTGLGRISPSLSLAAEVPPSAPSEKGNRRKRSTCRRVGGSGCVCVCVYLCVYVCVRARACVCVCVAIVFIFERITMEEITWSHILNIDGIPYPHTPSIDGIPRPHTPNIEGYHHGHAH